MIDFDSRVVACGFHEQRRRSEQAIRKTSAGVHVDVHTRSTSRSRTSRRSSRKRRRDSTAAIVVLSDGEDTSSLLPFEEVLDLAKRSETAIYAIGLRAGEGPSSTTKGFKEAEFVLRQFAQETGGRAFFPNQATDLNGIYGQIADELSSQYTVGYTSRNQRRDGSWRRIVVRTTRPNLTARTKQGYFAPTR